MQDTSATEEINVETGTNGNIIEETNYRTTENVAGCVTIGVSGTKHYDSALEALRMMNEIRTEAGLSELVMDVALREQAMLYGTCV